MKTPKRYHKAPRERAHLDLEPDSWEADFQQQDARWKRKNRVRKFKQTIAMLRYRLKDTEDCLRFTQKQTRFFLVRPDHWHHLDENGNELTRKEWKLKHRKEGGDVY